MILRSDNIPQLLEELKKSRFYGLLSLQFRDGEVTLVKREESFLTDKSAPPRGRTAHHDNDR